MYHEQFEIGCGAILNKIYYYYRSKVRMLLMGIYKMLLVYLDIATTNMTELVTDYKMGLILH